MDNEETPQKPAVEYACVREKRKAEKREGKKNRSLDPKWLRKCARSLYSHILSHIQRKLTPFRRKMSRKDFDNLFEKDDR